MPTRTIGRRLLPVPVTGDDGPDDIDMAAPGERTPEEDAAIRRQVTDRMIDGLSPMIYAVFLAIRDAMPAESVERLRSGRTIAIAVTMPSSVWRQTVFAAAASVVRDVWADMDPTIEVVASSSEVQPVRDYRGGGSGFAYDPASIVHELAIENAILCVIPGTKIPRRAEPFIDAVIGLEELDRDYIVAALRRRFPDDGEIRWPRRLPSASLDPVFVDIACERAKSAAEAIGYVKSLSDIPADQPTKPEADEKPAQEKSRNVDTRTIAKSTVLYPTSPALDDLSGYGAAATWGRDLCDDLAAYKRGAIGWADVDAGCLLYGPPGTGKTLFASALAASAGVAFVPTSYADWQSSGDGHAGHVIKTMRLRFETAGQHTPCILFIDELDTIGSRGSGGRNDDWFTMIITALLECLDGTARREGIVVIAATNYAAGLDPALVRSGRLDRRFEVGLPDEAGLAGIFRHHLPDVDDATIAPVAAALAGSTSGADVARIAREARRHARRLKREVTGADLLAVALPPDDRPDDLRRLVAVHEAGHAVAMMLAGRVPRSLSIVGGDGRHGGVVPDDVSLGLGRIGDIDAHAIPILAGRAAEEVILGQPSGGAGGGDASDLGRATALIANAGAMLGLDGRLVCGDQIPGEVVERRLRRLYAEAVLLIVRHRAAVEALAEIALERRVMGQSQLREFAAQQGILRGEGGPQAW